VNTPEYQIVQNPALGSIAIWHFVDTFSRSKELNVGAPIPLTTCVLPIVFHKESVDLLFNRRFEGGLLNARAFDRTLGVGLQERIVDMIPLSFASLNVGIASGLLTVDEENMTVVPGPLSAKPFRGALNVARIVHTARRLGYWFATRPLIENCAILRISF
jgi:hypothetical protein